jgi:hypothetical protein
MTTREVVDADEQEEEATESARSQTQGNRSPFPLSLPAYLSKPWARFAGGTSQNTEHGSSKQSKTPRKAPHASSEHLSGGRFLQGEDGFFLASNSKEVPAQRV